MGTAIRLSGTRGICSAPCAPLLEGVLRLSKNSFPIVAKRDNAKLGNHKPYHIFYGNTRGRQMRLDEIVL